MYERRKGDLRMDKPQFWYLVWTNKFSVERGRKVRGRWTHFTFIYLTPIFTKWHRCARHYSELQWQKSRAKPHMALVLMKLNIQ